jgi:hypothetical protein
MVKEATVKSPTLGTVTRLFKLIVVLVDVCIKNQ